MPVYSLEQAPKEVRELVARAQSGNLTPFDFCKELAHFGIEGPIKMFYIRDAFGLPLEEAKKIAIQYDYGSVEAWVEKLIPAIEDLASELDDTEKT
jgi:hypothetical protein